MMPGLLQQTLSPTGTRANLPATAYIYIRVVERTQTIGDSKMIV